MTTKDLQEMLDDQHTMSSKEWLEKWGLPSKYPEAFISEEQEQVLSDQDLEQQ